MRKVFAIAAMGLLVLTLPALAVLPTQKLVGADETSTGPRTGASPECLGTILWASANDGDTWLTVSGCYSAGSGGCMVNADTTGTGPWPGDWGRRQIADDFLAITDQPITTVKVWASRNASAANQGYSGDNPTPLCHGFCVTFYEAVKVLGSVYCPDGTLPGESFIGPKVYYAYATSFDTYWVDLVSLRYAYCVHLPYPAFYPTAGKWYWVACVADFDFQLDDPPTGYSQWFWRVNPGLGISQCEAMVWDGWNEGSGTAWTPISIFNSAPCWAGFDMTFKLYSGEPPVATEPTTWGKIKASYR